MKKQISLTLETLDLSNVENKLLVVKVPQTLTADDMIHLQEVFFSVLKDMGKECRVAFIPQGMDICLECPLAERIEREAKKDEDELIEGKKK